jgi:hypothetical protein
MEASNLTFDAGLHLIHADVLLMGDNEIINEPMCIDVGLPALLHSGISDTLSNRWCDPYHWKEMPFFICGCGDPTCRTFSFSVKHLDETRQKPFRVILSSIVKKNVYQDFILQIGYSFLGVIQNKPYHPHVIHTIDLVKKAIVQIKLARGASYGEF